MTCSLWSIYLFMPIASTSRDWFRHLTDQVAKSTSCKSSMPMSLIYQIFVRTQLLHRIHTQQRTRFVRSRSKGLLTLRALPVLVTQPKGPIGLFSVPSVTILGRFICWSGEESKIWHNRFMMHRKFCQSCESILLADQIKNGAWTLTTT